MAWGYKSMRELELDGYRFTGRSRCRSSRCGRTIGWWKTPSGKSLPLDPDTLQPHWATCPGASHFKQPPACRDRGYHQAASTVATRDPATGAIAEWSVCACGARIPFQPSAGASPRWPLQ